MIARPHRPRLMVPEVVQTSAMDCGPAVLTSVLGGFGIDASYGRLREACQTDVDGTSIDTLEEIANDLGLVAEQIIVPVDHVLLPGHPAIPAIAVVVLPNGFTHFVVAWRRHGPLVQVMDPAAGRRWRRCDQFQAELYVHRARVPASGWRAWAGSDVFLEGLLRRADACHTRRHAVQSMIQRAGDDRGWKSLAALDAALRMTSALAGARAFANASEATRTLERLFERARHSDAVWETIPEAYWSARDSPSPTSDPHVVTHGAVLLRVQGVREAGSPRSRPATIAPALEAALREAPVRPYRQLWHLLRADGVLNTGALTVALLAASIGVIAEAVLLGNLIDISHHFVLQGQRLGAVAALVMLVGVLFILELPIAAAVTGLGRRLEVRLRIAFLEKLPRLGDRYFSSRPSSDMAERSHSAHTLRFLPDLAAQVVRAVFELVLTTAAIAVVFPRSVWLALAGLAVAVVPSLLAQPLVSERDLRFRTHTGALARFSFDALVGAVAIRAHGAEASVRREHEALLTEWARAGYGLVRTVVPLEGVQLIGGFALAAALLLGAIDVVEEGGGILLLAYWALNIPLIGQELSQIVAQYPMHRNVTLRLLEPLGAMEQIESLENSSANSTKDVESRGAAFDFRRVTVKAGGHTLLSDIDFEVGSGTHVAIVGASGAGKSTLLGVLLGWHVPVAGEVSVDGARLSVADLRRQIAWIDPAVWLWNRSLLDNVEYGCPADEAGASGARCVRDAELNTVVERLPDGMQTLLGEGGARLSGGEGQRVRLARALGRTDARLVILDEPFRGLERERRTRLLARTRQQWAGATLLCVTHDIDEAVQFDRVLILEGGHLVAYGTPAALMAAPESRLRRLLDADVALREYLREPQWRQTVLERGKIHENGGRQVHV